MADKTYMADKRLADRVQTKSRICRGSDPGVRTDGPGYGVAYREPQDWRHESSYYIGTCITVGTSIARYLDLGTESQFGLIFSIGLFHHYWDATAGA